MAHTQLEMFISHEHVRASGSLVRFQFPFNPHIYNKMIFLTLNKVHHYSKTHQTFCVISCFYTLLTWSSMVFFP